MAGTSGTGGFSPAGFIAGAGGEDRKDDKDNHGRRITSTDMFKSVSGIQMGCYCATYPCSCEASQNYPYFSAEGSLVGSMGRKGAYGIDWGGREPPQPWHPQTGAGSFGSGNLAADVSDDAIPSFLGNVGASVSERDADCPPPGYVPLSRRLNLVSESPSPGTAGNQHWNYCEVCHRRYSSIEKYTEHIDKHLRCRVCDRLIEMPLKVSIDIPGEPNMVIEDDVCEGCREKERRFQALGRGATETIVRPTTPERNDDNVAFMWEGKESRSEDEEGRWGQDMSVQRRDDDSEFGEGMERLEVKKEKEESGTRATTNENVLREDAVGNEESGEQEMEGEEEGDERMEGDDGEGENASSGDEGGDEEEDDSGGDEGVEEDEEDGSGDEGVDDEEDIRDEDDVEGDDDWIGEEGGEEDNQGDDGFGDDGEEQEGDYEQEENEDDAGEEEEDDVGDEGVESLGDVDVETCSEGEESADDEREGSIGNEMGESSGDEGEGNVGNLEVGYDGDAGERDIVNAGGGHDEESVGGEEETSNDSEYSLSSDQTEEENDSEKLVPPIRYPCPECNKLLITQYHYKRHMKLKHRQIHLRTLVRRRQSQ